MDVNLKKILVDDLKLPKDGLDPHTSLDEAGLDSLAVVELSVLLEERFGIQVSEGDLQSAVTLAQLAQLIHQHRDKE